MMAVNSWKLSLLSGLAGLCFAPIFAQSQTLTFLPKTDYPAQGSRPFAVAVGDLNGDTYPDIISVNTNSGNINVFLNNGTAAAGTFAGAESYSIGNSPRSLIIADLNGDTHLDVAVANNATSTVAVRFGNGNGTFQASVVYAVGLSPTAIAVGDVDNDGFLDLVTVGGLAGGTGTRSVLLNNGIGTFATASNSTIDPGTGLVLADFDGDNKLDIAFTTTTFNRISVGKGLGNGAFDPMPALPLPTGGALGIRAADVDGDQILDLLTANTGNGLIGTSSYRKGDGTAAFSNEGDTLLGFIPVALALTDLDGDGFSDVIFVNNNGGKLSLGRGVGNGTFQPLQDFATGTQPNGIAIADVNRDGKSDLIAANFGSNSISVLINTTPVAGYSVSGRVLLEQTASAAVPLNFTFTPQDGSTIFTRTVTPAANGDYTLTVIPLKLYTVGIKGAKWLRSILVADTTTGNVTGLNATLRGGDANDDNAIDISDLLLLIAHYNQQQGTGGYLETADFNSDGSCDISDLLLLIGNYNSIGSP